MAGTQAMSSRERPAWMASEMKRPAADAFPALVPRKRTRFQKKTTEADPRWFPRPDQNDSSENFLDEEEENDGDSEDNAVLVAFYGIG